MHCLRDKVSEAQLGARLHRLRDLKILVLILCSQFVDQEFNLWVWMEARHHNLVCTRLWNRDATGEGVIALIGLSFARSIV